MSGTVFSSVEKSEKVDSHHNYPLRTKKTLNDSAAASVAGAPSKYANMKILELRKILSEQGLPTSGSAEEMRQRLAAGDGRSETDSAVAAPNHSTRKYDNMEVSETVSAVSAPNYSTRKYDNMKVLILRQELNKRALGISGSVDEMRQRLAEDDARSEKVADPQQDNNSALGNNCTDQLVGVTMDEEVPKANIVDNLVEVVAKSNFLDEFVGGTVPESSSEVEDSDEMVSFAVGTNEKKPMRRSRKKSPFLEQLVEGILESNPMPEYEDIARSASAGDFSPEHARNELEVQGLTLLRKDMRNLRNAIKQHEQSNRPNNPGVARDRKMALILKVLLRQLSSDHGQRLLRGEANIYHKGDVFAAEKSLVHTCRQSTLLGMSPPMAKKFHDRKNKNLLASLRKVSK